MFKIFIRFECETKIFAYSDWSFYTQRNVRIGIIFISVIFDGSILSFYVMELCQFEMNILNEFRIDLCIYIFLLVTMKIVRVLFTQIYAQTLRIIELPFCSTSYIFRTRFSFIFVLRSEIFNGFRTIFSNNFPLRLFHKLFYIQPKLVSLKLSYSSFSVDHQIWKSLSKSLKIDLTIVRRMLIDSDSTDRAFGGQLNIKLLMVIISSVMCFFQLFCLSAVLEMRLLLHFILDFGLFQVTLWICLHKGAHLYALLCAFRFVRMY